MTTSADRDTMRQVFYDVWQKHKNHLLLEPLEAMIVDIILSHPEYHDAFDHPEKMTDRESDASSLFLHISLHLAIREQIEADRPKGIRLIYENLCKKYQDHHVAEHRMLDCLAQILQTAHETGRLPDEQYYLNFLLTI